MIGDEVERARIEEMTKEYKSMPSFINGRRNPYKTALYNEMEIAMREYDMRPKRNISRKTEVTVSDKGVEVTPTGGE